MKKVKRHVGHESLWISPLKGCYPEARMLLRLAQAGLGTKGPESYKRVLPLYIRQAAVMERKS